MKAVAIAAFALCLSTAAAVAGDDADAPITYHVPGVTVVIQKHRKPIPLERGPKITWLHKAFTYDCLASECLIIGTSEAQSGSGAATPVCVYADGKQMRPECENQGDNGTVRNLQAKQIPQGVHSFQAGVGNESAFKETVCPCIITYEIYDSGN
jgi:hypothetical protein